MRKTSLFVIAVVLVLGTALSGCEAVRDSWKDTKELYVEYVVPTASVDLNNDDIDATELKLASLLIPLDVRLDALVRFLDGRDSLPDESWVEELFQRFPWVSGFMAVDMEGNELLREPAISLKPIDPQPFVALGEAWNDRAMRAVADDTPLGPEIYLAAPFFVDTVLRGVTVVHFDMRALVNFTSRPEELIVLTPTETLWAGGSDEHGMLLAKAPWQEILKSEDDGVLSAGGREFHWLVRYLGDLQIIYAVTEK